MKRITTTALALAVFAIAGGAFAQSGPQDANPAGANSTDQSNPGSMNQGASQGMNQGASMNQKDAKTVIDSWPDKTKTAAQALIDKYGQPDTVLNHKLAWYDKDQWSMVAVFRDSVRRATPTPHDAFIENAVNLKVPETKVGQLYQFDPGLVVDQTHGQIAANGDSEKANILALNLAHDIITGKRNVASAKSFYRDTLMKSVAGKSSPYMEKLQFTPSSSMGGTPGSEPSNIQSPSGSQPGSQQPSGASPENSPSGTSPSGTSPSQTPSGGY